MITLLYILLGLSILAPIYTYFLYPIVLRLLQKKSRKTMDSAYRPSVSILIIGNDKNKCKEKEKGIIESNYSNIHEVRIVANQKDASSELSRLKGQIVIVTDELSSYEDETIANIVAPFCEHSVGCVSGMVRKAPDKLGKFHDGANWIYENKIKVLESNIGSLSGANTAIYAFRKDMFTESIRTKINLDFFIPTTITEKGFDVIFEPAAVAFEKEEKSTNDLFKKHILDGTSGYRSIIRFWRLLLPRKGSFVFWSHRVMKWLVPFNILFLIIGCAILARHLWALILLITQIITYSYLGCYYLFFTVKNKDIPGHLGKLSGFASYFLILNVAWFIGFIQSFKR